MTTAILGPLQTLDASRSNASGFWRVHVRLSDGGQLLAEFRPRSIDLFMPRFTMSASNLYAPHLPDIRLYHGNAGRLPYAPQDRKTGQEAARADGAAILGRALEAACGPHASARVTLAIRIVSQALQTCDASSGLLMLNTNSIVLPGGAVLRTLASNFVGMLDGVRSCQEGKFQPVRSLPAVKGSLPTAHARASEVGSILAEAERLLVLPHVALQDISPP